MDANKECECVKPGIGFWLSVLIFLIIIAVIVLSAINITSYSDILQGNKNAPGISDGEAIGMIIANVVLIIFSIFAIIGVVRSVYKMALGPNPDKLFMSRENTDGSASVIYKNYGDYTPNKFGTNLFLWIFSTLATIISALNIIQYTKISQGSSENDTVTVGTAYILLTWVVFALCFGYWGYVSFRTFVPRKYQPIVIQSFKPSNPERIYKLDSNNFVQSTSTTVSRPLVNNGQIDQLAVIR